MILNVENKAKLVKLGPVWVTYLKQCMTISSLSSPRSRKLGHPLTLSFLPELFVPPHCQSPPVCCCFCLWGYQTDSLEEALGLGSARRRGDQSAILRNNGTELFLRHLLTRRSRDVCRSGLGTGLDEPMEVFARFAPLACNEAEKRTIALQPCHQSPGLPWRGPKFCVQFLERSPVGARKFPGSAVDLLFRSSKRIA